MHCERKEGRYRDYQKPAFRLEKEFATFTIMMKVNSEQKIANIPSLTLLYVTKSKEGPANSSKGPFWQAKP